MRQFLYISKTKVDSLEAGLWRRRKPQVTLTAGASVLKLAVTTPSEMADLYRRTDALVRKMERHKHLVSLPEQGELSDSQYYSDDSEWAHGLFSFKGDFSLEQADARVVTYLLWRRWQDSIILLAGSPLNVLGEQVVREGVWAYGTTGTLATLVHFTKTALHTGEANVVGLAPPGTPPEGGGLSWVGETAWPAADQPDQELRLEILSSPPGLALAALCIGHLSALPVGRIDTAFRISQSFGVNLRGNVPRWAADLLSKHGGREKLDFLRQCQVIYVGSPLFTALPSYRSTTISTVEPPATRESIDLMGGPDPL